MSVESVAPGSLESIRVLLNTWHLPNDTRQPVDGLSDLAGDRSAWAAKIPDLRFPSDDADRRSIEALRAKLRASLRDDGAEALSDLVTAHRWRLSVEPHADIDTLEVHWRTDPPSTVGDALGIVVGAVVAGTWARLRACPDCHWVFYDTSRNGRRTWCSMTASDGARGCGSIAKTRAYRQRQRATATQDEAHSTGASDLSGI